MDGIPAIADDVRDPLRALFGRNDLIANKRALGRTRDRADVEMLEELGDD